MLIWSRVLSGVRGSEVLIFADALYVFRQLTHVMFKTHCTITIKAQHFQFQVLSYLSNSAQKIVLLSDVSGGMLVLPFLLYKDRHHSLLSDM